MKEILNCYIEVSSNDVKLNRIQTRRVFILKGGGIRNFIQPTQGNSALMTFVVVVQS